MGAWGGASLESGPTGLLNSRSYTGLQGIGDAGRPLRSSVARGGLRNSPADPGCPVYANPGLALEPVQSAGQHDLCGPHLLLQPVALAFQGGSWLLSGIPVWLNSDQMHTKSNGYSVARPPFLLRQGFTV